MKEKQRVVGSNCNPTAGEHRGRQEDIWGWGGWPTSLAKSASSGFSERPLFKNKVFREPLGQPNQQFKRRPLMLLLGILLGGLWLLGGTLSAQMRKFHLNYICIFIHRIRLL